MAQPVVFENVTVIRATPKALLCVWDGAEHWVPDSMIEAESEVYRNKDGTFSEGTLVVRYWWAEQAGLV